MTTLIISDIHLGSRNTHPKLLLRLLHSEFDRLILNGDTVNNLNFKKLKPKHWMILGQLREIARKRELILIRGNHDVEDHRENLTFGPMDMLSTVLGVELLEEFRLDVGGRRYLVLHGDRFDPTLAWPILTDAADWCYQTTQKIHKRTAKWLKQRVKKMGGVIQFVKRGAARYARERGCDGIICGHTHFSDDDHIDDVHYLNTGCWTDHPCTFIRVEGDAIQLHEWDENSAPIRRTLPSPQLPHVTLNGHGNHSE